MINYMAGPNRSHINATNSLIAIQIRIDELRVLQYRIKGNRFPCHGMGLVYRNLLKGDAYQLSVACMRMEGSPNSMRVARLLE